MDNYVTSRVILLSIFVFHCFLGYGGAGCKIYVPPKLYFTAFVAEVLAVTGYIVHTCISEPFYSGIAMAVLGYLFVYLIIFTTFVGLKYWTINPNKIYRFTPKYTLRLNGNEVVEGYIEESGTRFTVYVDDINYVKEAEKSIILVKYRNIYKFSIFVDLA